MKTSYNRIRHKGFPFSIDSHKDFLTEIATKVVPLVAPQRHLRTNYHKGIPYQIFATKALLSHKQPQRLTFTKISVLTVGICLDLPL